jgi:tetratricopeptide (TPR) repeat protein
MDIHLDRAGILLQQGRYALAEQEVRARLLRQPEDSFSHALLALCLSYQEKHQEATSEAEQGIHYGPDQAFPHYVMGTILLKRNRFDEAAERVSEAITIDPHDADYFSLLASIRMEQRRWTDALDAARQGLEVDPEHAGSKNLYAMALVNLGRKEEAGIALKGALSKDPENALSHANQGWALLHTAQHKEALGHFREALRLDPDLEWARQGIVEAMKARYFIYGVMLRYFLWMSRLSTRTQWLVVIGAWVVYKTFVAIAKSHPQLAPAALPIIICYFIFVFLTWTSSALFNLLLRLDRFGRLVLSHEQIVASNWLAGCLLTAIVSAAVGMITANPVAISAALVFGFLSLPVSAIFRCHIGWPRNTMTGYTVVLAVLGLSFLVGQFGNIREEPGPGIVGALGGFFLLGSALAMIVANVLINKQPTV